ncbi:MAG: ABC transporter permease, partial [bacterium]
MKWRLLVLQIATPLLAILFGVLIASIIVLAIGQNPLDVFGVLIRFGLLRSDSLLSILFKATPLIFAGLAVALSFRATLWNIGVEGQFY